MSALLILVGFIALCVALVGVLKGGVAHVGLTGRKPSAVAAGGAFVVMMIGGALAPPDQSHQNASGDAARVDPQATATVLASRTPTPTLTQAPTAELTPSPTTTPSPSPSPSRTRATTDEVLAAAAPGTALAVLGTLAVKGRASKAGYSRDLFGPAWADTNRNGCDTRNDILKRDLTGETVKAGTNGCVVLSGWLADPYTARVISFTKSDAAAVQIDHVVSLSDAWQTGAQAWPAAKRLAFANDPLDLLAVDGSANAAKSDSDAASWLPPNKSYRCAMVARQTAVKAKYGLWVKPAERDAIARVLAACPSQPAPTGGNPTLAPSTSTPRQATSAPSPKQTTGPAPAPAGARGYANCTEMHQDYKGGVARPGAVDKRKSGHARYAPYYSQALYDANTKSDRDHDGVACEQ